MALQKDIVLSNGLSASAAYHKVTMVEIRAFGTTVDTFIAVSTYVDKAMADVAGDAVITRKYRMVDFDIAQTSMSAGAQIYLFLKQNEDFSSAIDV